MKLLKRTLLITTAVITSALLFVTGCNTDLTTDNGGESEVAEVLDTAGTNNSEQYIKLILSGTPVNNKVYGYVTYTIPVDQEKVFKSMSAKIMVPNASHDVGLLGAKGYWKAGKEYDGDFVSAQSDTWTLVTIPSSKTKKVSASSTECGLLVSLTTTSTVSNVVLYVDDIKINYYDGTNEQLSFENDTAFPSTVRFTAGTTEAVGAITLYKRGIIEFVSETKSDIANTEAVLGLVATSASTSDQKVATVSIVDAKIAITSVAAGSAIITCTDTFANNATISITVDDAGKIGLGTIIKYAVPFTVQTNSDTANTEAVLGLVAESVSSSVPIVVTAKIDSGKIKITSIAAGTAIITCTDASSNNATISITVSSTGTVTIGTITKYIPLFTAMTDSSIANSNANLGLTAVTVISSDEKVATVKIDGDKIAITSVAEGAVTITCKDTFAHIATIAISVSKTGTITIGTVTKYVVGYVSYYVKHFKATVNGTYGSTADEVESLSSKSGVAPVYTQKTYTGFSSDTINNSIPATVAESGDTVVCLYYKRNTITITFNANSGTLSGSGTVSGLYEATVTAPVNPTRDGYSFIAWNPSVPSTYPAADLTCVAQWTANAPIFTVQTNSDIANTTEALGITATSVESSSAIIATVAIVNGKIAITSVAAGTAIVTCTDASSHSATIAVTVSSTGVISVGVITKYVVPVSSGKCLKLSYSGTPIANGSVNELKGYITYTPTDTKVIKSISGKIYIPAETYAKGFSGAKIFWKTGSSWTWGEGTWTDVEDTTWTSLSGTSSSSDELKNGGIQIYSKAQSSAVNGLVFYFDDITINFNDNTSVSYTFDDLSSVPSTLSFTKDNGADWTGIFSIVSTSDLSGNNSGDEESTLPTKAELLNYLKSVYKSKVLSGQMQCAWSTSIDMKTRVNTLTEKYPAIMGFDFMNFSTGDGRGDMISEASSWAQEGGIVTYCWHWRDPNNKSGDFYSSNTSFRIPYSNGVLDITSSDFTAMKTDMDTIAAKLKVLKDAGIVVLWRPFHEAGGDPKYNNPWFWWGASGADAYKALYKYMYTYFTTTKSLDNLIWVWNGQNSAWYPGDDYVDLAGEDIYASDTSSQVSMWNSVNTWCGSNKMVALTENGRIPDPSNIKTDGAWWLYFLTWNDDDNGNNYLTGSSYNGNTAKGIYASDLVITRDELPTNWSLYK